MKQPSQSILRVLIGMLLAALVLTACGGDDDDSGAAASDSNKPTSTTVALTGAPVTIGFVDLEGELGVDYSPQRKAAAKIVGHLNGGGGIGGHPIALKTCITKISSGGADCANEMVRAKAVLVLSYSVVDSGPMYSVLKSAGIPVLGTGACPCNIDDLSPDGNHYFLSSGALAYYLVANVFIADSLHAKTVGVLVGSSAVAQQAADNFIKAPLAKKGIDVKTVQLAASNPDYTAPLNSLSHTDALLVLTACAQQDEAIKQAVALGYEGKILGCIDPTDLKAMGDAAKGLYAATQVKPLEDPQFADDADVKAWLDIADELDIDHAATTAGVYSILMAGKAVIEKAGGPGVTGSDVLAAIKATDKLAVPLLSPEGMTCSKPQSPIIATSCNVQNMMVQVQDDAKTVRAVDGAWLAPPTA